MEVKSKEKILKTLQREKQYTNQEIFYAHGLEVVTSKITLQTQCKFWSKSHLKILCIDVKINM